MCNIFIGSNTINIGSNISTINTNKIICNSDIITNSGNLITTSNTCNIFTNANLITIGNCGVNSKFTINSKQLEVLGNININAIQTTFNSGTGYISGNLICSQPFQGNSLKMIMIHFNNVKTSSSWTIIYTIPTSFTILPQQIINYNTNQFTINILSTSLIQVISVSSLNTGSGSCIIYGY